MRRTGPVGGDSGRGSHAASQVASGCLPKCVGTTHPEVHHGQNAYIIPRDDRILIKRIDPPPSSILLTDAPKSIKGVILSVGPGKWHPGEWWRCKVPNSEVCCDDPTCPFTYHCWKWIPGYREPVTVQPGQIVAFNSRWNDLAHAENAGTGADGKGKLERPLSYKLAKDIHLVREADIFGILPNEHVKVEYLRTGMEELFVNRSIA